MVFCFVLFLTWRCLRIFGLLISIVTLQDDSLVYSFSNFFNRRHLFKKHSVGQIVLYLSAFLFIYPFKINHHPSVLPHASKASWGNLYSSHFLVCPHFSITPALFCLLCLLFFLRFSLSVRTNSSFLIMKEFKVYY